MKLAFDCMAASCEDYRHLAERRLPRFLFDYIDGGAGDEHTLVANCRDFQRLHLRQRVLCDVEGPDTRCELIGQAASMPLALAPLGMAGLYARRGSGCARGCDCRSSLRSVHCRYLLAGRGACGQCATMLVPALHVARP